MQRLLSFIKNTLHTTFLMVIIVVAIAYVSVHYNIAGLAVNGTLTERLTEKLNARIEVSEIEVNWLNQVAMNGVVIYDQQEDTLLYARRVMVAYEFIPLVRKELVLNTIQLIDFTFNISRDSLNGTPNYDFLVEALAPRQENMQRRFINDAAINALLLRQGTITYNIKDQPRVDDPLIIDQNHFTLTNISASMKVNISHITGLDFWLKRLSLMEMNGLSLNEMSMYLKADSGRMDISNASIEAGKMMADGSYYRIESQLKSVYEKDTLNFGIGRLRLYSGNTFDLNLSADAVIDINQPDSALVKANIAPSFITSSVLTDILHINNIYNENLSILNDTIESVSVSGEFVANKGEFSYNGKINTNGLLTSANDCDVKYDGDIAAKVNSRIKTLPYHRHTYQNIWVNARYEDNFLHSQFGINDPDCTVRGSAEARKKSKSTDFSVRANFKELNLHALNLTEWENVKDLNIAANLKGDISISNRTLETESKSWTQQDLPTGFVRIDSICMNKGSDTLRLDPIRLNIMEEQDMKVAVLQSPLINILCTPSDVLGTIPAHKDFARFLTLDAMLDEPASFTAGWHSDMSTIQFIAEFPSVIYNGANINATFSANGTTIEGKPVPDYLTTRLDLKYHTEAHEIKTKLRAAVEADPFYVVFEPSTITIDGKDFATTGAQIIKQEDKNYLLQDLSIHDNDQHLNISGYLSHNNGVDLLVETNRWQTDFFFDLLGKKYLDFGGYATGDILISSESGLHLSTDSLILDEFTYIGHNLGTHFVTCFYDLENSRLLIDSDINTTPDNNTHAKCDIMMGDVDSLDLRFNANNLPVEFASNWVGGILQDLHGFASGDVRLYGKFSDLNLVGHPILNNISFTHDLLGARFNMSDTLYMDTDSTGTTGVIRLNNAHVRDINGQEAFANVNLKHHYFSDMEYDVDIVLPDNDNGFLVFDHPQQINSELYWGRIWATGNCQMHGVGSNHKINLQMSTAGHSVFNLSPGEESFSDSRYNFLTFRDKRFVGIDLEDINLGTDQKATGAIKDEPSYIDADLLIHANERCQVFVQLDPLAEDRMTCRGNGDLSVHYDPFHDITVAGNYDINQGSYTVNMRGDLMTKAFALQEGSRIVFPGVPSNAELTLKAVYNIPSANLRDLDESFASLSSMSRTTLPVDCKLLVNGQITAPQISFDLEVKNTSDDVQALVHNIIGTQEMLNREVFYLLLFSKFYTPEYASTSQRQSGSELTSFASSSLTSQLNNLLGHISDNFTLGTNVRSDKGDFSDMEMDVSVSTRLLNDRLVLNGNLGYRDPANRIGMGNNNNSFIGDFDAEWMINHSGTIRAKAYSHYNDRDYSINNALTTQGAGIILRRDFKNFKDLLHNGNTK